MSGELYCPKCGSKHDTSDRYCQYCGEDLEEVIVQYKSKQLPIRYQNGSAQSGPTQGATQYSGAYESSRADYDKGYHRRRRRRYRDDGGFWDVFLSILFFWMCCGPGDCDCR